MTGSITRRLRLASASLRTDRVAVRTLLDAHDPVSHGALLILLSALCLLPVPGLGVVFGMGIAGIAAQMFCSSGDVRLPPRVASLELSRPFAQRVLGLVIKCYSTGDRWMKARLGDFTGGAVRRLVASATALMAVLIVLPIPFGNFLPAIALIIVGCGLVFRDGVALIIGFGMAAVAVLFSAMVTVAIWHFGGVRLYDWIQGLAA